jgi:hypothetical protein
MERLGLNRHLSSWREIETGALIDYPFALPARMRTRSAQMGRLALLKGEGRVRVHSDNWHALWDPSPQSAPPCKGRGETIPRLT